MNPNANQDDLDIEAFENNNPTIGSDTDDGTYDGQNEGADQGGENDVDADDEGADANATPPATTKKPAKVEKLLSERNEYKSKYEQAMTRNTELESKLGSDPAIDKEYINNQIDARVSKAQLDTLDRMEKNTFFQNNPKAKEVQEALDGLKDEHPTLSYKDAYKLYLANNGRSMELVDPAELKSQNKFGIGGQSPNSQIKEEDTDAYEARMKADFAKGKTTPFTGR